MNIRSLTLLFTFTLFLSGCNLLNVLPTADLGISFSESSQLTVLVTIDEDTGAASFAVPEVRLRAHSKPGSIGANLSNYSIDYFYATGDKIPTGTGESFRGSLAMSIPAGVSCEGDSVPCTINSPDAFYAKSEDIFSAPFSPIDLDVITELNNAGPCLLYTSPSPRDS